MGGAKKYPLEGGELGVKGQGMSGMQSISQEGIM